MRQAALLLAALTLPGAAQETPRPIDERPAAAGEWGFRPVGPSRRNPPSFSWRPQRDAASYELEVARDEGFAQLVHEARELDLNVHCPSRAFDVEARAPLHWRFRFVTPAGERSAWSGVRSFTLEDAAEGFTLPERDELLARLPSSHPRLFVRPESLPALRERFAEEFAEPWAALLARCNALLADPPATEEPARYPQGMERGSDPWRELWWGNRKRCITVLESAATLAFAWRLGDDERHGELATRLLLEAAAWDPKGATGYRYNDEAGMPYAYHFSRAYTFLHARLSEEQRTTCRHVMAVRGAEMYAHLCPQHLWKPYSSHSNRAWHFLGEVAIAFHGELEEADDWLWFAANVFANVYPVWSDDDGGWHEGTAYWRSYLSRFTWWADVAREALALDAYELPFFAEAGDWPLYVLPPGTRGGGFGDQCAARSSADTRDLMTVLAGQALNPVWEWYVEQLGGPSHEPGYVGLLRRAAGRAEPAPPLDRSASHAFRGVGQVALNATLLDARDNVELLFKSSPFGSQSHGYEAQNAFLLYAYGERLLIRSGKRDSYGSDHHRRWMWETKSVNSITVDGRGQEPHSARAVGRIERFVPGAQVDLVSGRAEAAYGGRLDLFRRTIVFVKPDWILLVDELEAPAPAQFTFHLHSAVPFERQGERAFTATNGGAACRVEFLEPAELAIETTDRFDPPPRPRVKLVEHHLAATTEPLAKTRIVTLIRPHRADGAPARAVIERSAAAVTIAGAGVRLELGPAGELTIERERADGTMEPELSLPAPPR